MKLLNTLVVLVSIFSMAACTDNSDSKANGDHVWKDQTDSINKAREVEALMKKTVAEQRKSIEEQTK